MPEVPIQHISHRLVYVDTLFEDFCTLFRMSADQCFGPPVARTKATRRRTPWWSVECQTAVIEHRKAVKLFKTHPTQKNSIACKRLTANARYIKMERKKIISSQIYGKFVSKYTQVCCLEKPLNFLNLYIIIPLKKTMSPFLILLQKQTISIF